MKEKLAVLIIVMASIVSVRPALAVTIEDYHIYQGEIVTLPVGETVKGDYFATGNTIEISGIVNGDVYALGNKIILNGTVNGDLLAAGSQITINGAIKQDARVAGGQIALNGPIGGNLTVGGGNVDLGKEALLAGNLTAGAGNLTVNSPVSGNLRVGAGNLTISNRIEGNVVGGIGKMLVTSTGSVKGDVVYWSKLPEDLHLTKTATVSGQIKHQTVPGNWDKWRLAENRELFKDSLNRAFNVFHLFGLISSLIIGYLVIHFLPNFSVNAIKLIETNSWSVGFIGLSALILTPFVGVFLLFSLIGIPAAFILFTLYGLVLYLSQIIFIYWLGARLIHRLGREAGKTITLLIGGGVNYLLTSIAIFGPLVGVIGLCVGLGAVLLTGRNHYLTSRQQTLL